MSDETADRPPSEGEEAPEQPGEFDQTVDAFWENATESPLGEAMKVGAEEMFKSELEASLELERDLEAKGCSPGCGLLLAAFVGMVLVGIGMFLAVQSGWFGFVGSDGPGGSSSEVGASAPSDTATDSGSTGEIETPVAFAPQPGIYEIENLPFVEACGPGSLGSGFDEGTIEVLDEGASIIATGSQPGSASFELLLVDAAPGRLEYLGFEPVTGIEMTMVFTSSTDMQATVRFGGEICIERPARGTWDREIGEPDPDAEEVEALPEWMPAGFPVAGSGQVDTIETPTSKTVTVVVVDTHPTDVLVSIAEWAVEEGHPIVERSATTLTIQLPENQLMDVEVVDLGNFNTQLTVTIEDM